MRRSTCVAAAIAAIATLFSAQSAQAEGLGGSDGVRYVRTTVTLPASTGAPTTARAVATCPVGWEAVGGGHTIDAGENRAISAGMKFGKRQWYARAWQSNHAATTLTTYAVCLRTTGMNEEDQTEHGLPAGPVSVDQAGACPGGHVISGGVSYTSSFYEPTDADKFTLNSNYPIDDVSDVGSIPDDGWRGRVHYTGDGDHELSVFLWCLPGKLPAYTRTAVTVPAGKSIMTRAVCPAGRPVLSGGVRASGPSDASHLTKSRPIDTRDAGAVPDDGWRGGITNTSDQNVTMTVFAVCR